MKVLIRCPHCESTEIFFDEKIESCSLLGMAYDLVQMGCYDCKKKLYVETTYKIDTIEVRKTRD